MPRIAAAVAVVVTVAVSIGINIARFPVVWEMVGSTEFSSELREAALATDPTESTPIADLSQVAPPASLAPPPIDPASRRSMLDSAPVVPYEEPGVSTRFVSSRPAASESAELHGTQPEPPVADAPRDPLPGAMESPSRPVAHEAGVNASPASDASSAYSPPDVGASSDTRWPAELSPAIKYASNRPLSGGSPEVKPATAPRPLVPVVWPEGTSSPGQASVLPVSAQDRVERLPPVDEAKPSATEDVAQASDGPAPVYPTTGR